MNIKPISEIPMNREEEFEMMINNESQWSKDLNELMQLVDKMEAPISERIILVDKINKVAAEVANEEPIKADNDKLRRLFEYKLLMGHVSRSEHIPNREKIKLIDWLHKKSAEVELMEDISNRTVPKIKTIP